MAIQESRAELAAPAYDLSPERLATGRLAVLEEMDPDLRTPDGRAARVRLGPYFGFIGRIPGGTEGEPRLRDLYVTQLENLAACPWQLFLLRLLRIEPTPDPLGALPGRHPPAARQRRPRRARQDRPSPRARGGARRRSAQLDPARGRLAGGARRRAAPVRGGQPAARRGGDLPPRPRPRPRRAVAGRCWRRRATWTGPAAPYPSWRPRSRASSTSATPPAPCATSLFQADRVDKDAGGLVIWTDYKTGRPISSAHKPEVRRRHFLDRVRKGTHLQAVAYLLGSDGESKGRYLFLRPGLDDGDREMAVTTADRDFIEAFAAASEAGARRLGGRQLLPAPGRARRPQGARPLRLLRRGRGLPPPRLRRPPAPLRMDRAGPRRTGARGGGAAAGLAAGGEGGGPPPGPSPPGPLSLPLPPSLTGRGGKVRRGSRAAGKCDRVFSPLPGREGAWGRERDRG